MENKIKEIYGEKAGFVIKGVGELIKKYSRNNNKPELSEKDVMLISYGDAITREGEAPLKTLKAFLEEYAADAISAVHILPCFPYTSDDGFSVTDYLNIDPALGEWQDVEALSGSFDIMLDAVVNHCSVKSEWFRGFLAGDEKYKNYFITADPNGDYSKVIRPRISPLLTKFNTSDGEKYVWTTFSADQADLNYDCPELFLDVLEVIGTYILHGARFIRLDAIGFLYKKAGTSCMHLKETHTVIQIIRAFIDRISPGTVLITETNVPHEDNISYFGSGGEAHMVYQFPLPTLTLHSFQTQNAQKLSSWAAGLGETPENTTYFNFLASHDGIGVRPSESILTKEEIAEMAEKTTLRGGFVSYKDNGDGTQSPYELNINYMDALSNPDDTEEVKAGRMLAAHTILLSVAGVPGIYYHSLLGSGNDRQAALSSGINRRINREKPAYDTLTAELKKPGTRKRVADGMRRIIGIRRTDPAFSPKASQEVLSLDSRVFAVKRHNLNTGDTVCAFVNVSGETVTLDSGIKGRDLLGGGEVNGLIELPPFGFIWVKL